MGPQHPAQPRDAAHDASHVTPALHPALHPAAPSLQYIVYSAREPSRPTENSAAAPPSGETKSRGKHPRGKPVVGCFAVVRSRNPIGPQWAAVNGGPGPRTPPSAHTPAPPCPPHPIPQSEPNWVSMGGCQWRPRPTSPPPAPTRHAVSPSSPLPPPPPQLWWGWGGAPPPGPRAPPPAAPARVFP